MGLLKTLADTTYRDYNTDGVPSSGAFRALKSAIRTLFTTIEVWLAGGAADVVLHHGAVGDGVADDTAALQAAAATGKPVRLPVGTFRVTDAIPLALGQLVFGAGRLKSIILVDDTFNLSAAGVLTSPNGEGGPDVRDIAITFEQPDTTVRANLVAYPPAFFFQNSARHRLGGVRVTGGMIGIDARGNTGGAKMRDLELSCFDTAIIADGALDTVYINTAHLYPFGLTANQLTIYGDQATVGIDCGRVDALELSNIFTISLGKGIWLHEGAAPGTVTNATIANYWDDSGRALVVSAGNVSVAGMHSGLTKDWSQTIVHTGGNLAVAGLTIRDQIARTGPAISTNGAGDVTLITIAGMTATMFDTDNTLFKSEGGSNTWFSLSGVSTFRYPNVAYTKPTVHIASGRGNINGLTSLDKGTGAGVLLQIDSNDLYQLSNINPVGWTVTIPSTVSIQNFPGMITLADGATWSSTGIADTASYSTASTPVVGFLPTWNFSSTSSGIAPFVFSPTMVPAGASAGNVNALAVGPTVGTSAVNQSTQRAINAGVTVSAGYSGTLSAANAYGAFVVNNGNNPITTTTQYAAIGTGNGNGITTGVVTNIGFGGTPHSAAAGVGGTVYNIGGRFDVGTGDSAGTRNYGVYITGNGGATAINFATLSDSPAPSAFSGKLTAALLNPGSYTVATLPAGSAGDVAYASNGRKAGEGAGSGTGVLVFKDASNWIAVDTGATAAA